MPSVPTDLGLRKRVSQKQSGLPTVMLEALRKFPGGYLFSLSSCAAVLWRNIHIILALREAESDMEDVDQDDFTDEAELTSRGFTPLDPSSVTAASCEALGKVYWFSSSAGAIMNHPSCYLVLHTINTSTDIICVADDN